MQFTVRSGLGCTRPGALADSLVLEGKPFANLGLFEDAGRNIPMIMKDGDVVRCLL
jgi:imidazolonepropionase-like amidohydrolase